MNKIPQILKDHPSLLRAIYECPRWGQCVLSEPYKSFIITQDRDEVCRIWAKMKGEMSTLCPPNQHWVYWCSEKSMKKAKYYIEQLLKEGTRERNIFCRYDEMYVGDLNLYPIGGI